MTTLSDKGEAGPAVALARRMFWRTECKDLTAWGNLFASVISGICSAARMLPPQRKLWLLLFLRSHKCIANHIGSNAYIICCGPPETGKSAACRFWLACMPTSLQRMNDGQSAKAHTAMDPDTDMQVCFQDELQEHVSADSLGDNAKQTLISNGPWSRSGSGGSRTGRSRSKRRRRRAGRSRGVRNNLCDVKDAVKSRATIVAVPALKTTSSSNSASMLASIGCTKQTRSATGSRCSARRWRRCRRLLVAQAADAPVTTDAAVRVVWCLRQQRAVGPEDGRGAAPGGVDHGA